MLRPRVLSAALNKMNTGGVESVLLFSPEGVLLAFTSLAGDSERTKAAIAANVWNAYQRHLEFTDADKLQEIMLQFTEGRLIVTKLASLLLCVHGSKDVPLGMLRAKSLALVQNLSEPLQLLSLP